MTTKTFNVPKMHCSSCVMLLEGIEDELPGIEKIDASYQKQRMTVTYDEAQVDEAQIVAAAEKEGYTAVPAEGESNG